MSTLRAPLRSFYSEAAWLQCEFGLAAKLRQPPNQLTCEMCVLRLHDAWARFCRELVIASAIGHTFTLGGTVLKAAPGISSRASVIPALLATYRKRQTDRKSVV